MAGLSQAQVIELFHLTFVHVLGSRMGREHYVVKGGANLRYFFDSHRYSEGIDFDALTSDAWRLEEQVDGALASAAMVALLRGSGVSIRQVAKPKQTDTTQRWKILLDTPDRDAISTKIEFSRRGGDSRWLLEAVPSRVVSAYGIRPPTLLHYTAAAAAEQKIMALASRMETQARDVFDLDLLFRTEPGAVEKGTLGPATISAALERCIGLPFEAFEAQVVPFLDPDVAELYRDRSSWEQMQSFVVDRLGDLADENR